jgi:acetyl esterase/lipase
VVWEPDVVYGKGDGEELRLDLGRPQSLNQPAPCVVVIHGGAWRGGNKNAHKDLVLKLAQAGYVSASLGYRFCPKHPFPAQVEDVKCAVRYLRAHASQYHLDAQRFGAVGFSAGAHLSMMLGVMGAKDGLEGEGGWADQPSQVQAVVAFFGPTDLAAPDIPLLSRGLLRDFIGGLPKEKPDQYRRASPITYVSAGDAPLLIFQGTKDPLVPHSQAYRMTDALTKAGVPGRVEMLIGAGHGWGGAELERTWAETEAFFGRYLKPASLPRRK